MNEIMNAQWEVAQAVHDILVKENFKEDFETEEKFANFIGISRSNCNKMKKAVDFRNNDKTFEGWTLNKIYEIMCLPKEEEPKTEEKEEAEPAKESLLHSFIDTLTTEETVKVLSYIKKQHIGDTEAVEEVLKLWK